MKQHDPDAVARIERETWDRSAASYRENAAKLTSHAVNLLIEAARLTPDVRALEVGCGPGHITNMMAKTGAKVTGVDLAPGMVNVASELYPNIEFKEANAEHLPFEADSFDVVLVNFSIHHFAQPGKACAEIRRVLKPGGRFVFAGPIEQFGFGAFIEGLTAHHTMDELPHGPIYLGATREDYENLLGEAGFEDYEVTIRQLTLSLQTLDPLIHTGWEMCELSKLPQVTQERIRETTVEKVAPYKCARAARDAVKRLGIEIRAGIHTGECEVQGRNLSGLAVHIAARVQAAATPGEVLVSETVKVLAIGSGIRFEDRGEQSLKGVPGEWRLYSVVAGDQ